MTKTQKIQLLIEHCQRRGTMADLVAVLAQTRPMQFRQFFGGATPEQVAQQVRSAPLPVYQKPRIDLKWCATIIVALLACIAAWLVVPEIPGGALGAVAPAEEPPEEAAQDEEGGGRQGEAEEIESRFLGRPPLPPAVR